MDFLDRPPGFTRYWITQKILRRAAYASLIIFLVLFARTSYREYNRCHTAFMTVYDQEMHAEQTICTSATHKMNMNPRNFEKQCGVEHRMVIQSSPWKAGADCVVGLLNPSSHADVFSDVIEFFGGSFWVQIVIMAWTAFFYLLVLRNPTTEITRMMFKFMKKRQLEKRQARARDAAENFGRLGLPHSAQDTDVFNGGNDHDD